MPPGGGPAIPVRRSSAVSAAAAVKRTCGPEECRAAPVGLPRASCTRRGTGSPGCSTGCTPGTGCTSSPESTRGLAEQAHERRVTSTVNKSARLGLTVTSVDGTTSSQAPSSSRTSRMTPGLLTIPLPSPLPMSPLLAPPVDTPAAPSPLPSPLANVHLLPAPGPLDGPFYGETIPVVPWPSSRQVEFAADLCRLMLVSNVAWWAVDQPYWRAFFAKWIPQCLMPGSRQLSGRILDEEAGHVVEGVKMKVHSRYATGQCDGWKNINKTSIVASMINVEYTVCEFSSLNLVT